MLGTKNKKLGFTLIETIIALGFLALIAMFLLPALSKLNENSKKFKDQAKIVYALQAAIEEEKSFSDSPYGSKLVNINGYDIYIDRQSYRENLDYIKAVGKDLFGEVQVQEETSDDSSEDNLLALGESQADYDEFRGALVNAYGFSQESVDQMSNYDLDLAYTRAQQRLEETGFGDIGLIINEIAKMYPGSSDMYPGY